MNKENPPTSSVENKEQYEENLAPNELAATEEEVAVETPENRQASINALNKDIEEAIAKKDTGEELLNEKHVEIPHNFETPKKNFGSSLWRKAMVTLGLTGIMGAAAAKTTSGETNPSDTTNQEKTRSIGQEKMVFTEANQEVAGITFKGMLTVPTADTSYEYFFVGFDGNSANQNKIEDMKKALKEMGFDAGTKEDLKQVYNYNGTKLTDKIGYGMAIGGEAGMEGDDTRAGNVNVGEGPEIGNYATINPEGQLNRFEHGQINTLEYGDYAILAKKKKDTKTANYADFTKN